VSRLTGSRAGAAARWAALKERYTWLRHIVSAWVLLQRNNGSQYAAAITYFSFLALFPLLLLAVSVAGFILHSDPALEQDFFAQLTDKVPGAFGKTLKESVQAAIDSRAGLGLVGLAGVLLTGLGWVGKVRTAIDAVWGRTARQVNFVKAKLANLVVLAGLGIGAVVSIGLTVVGTSLTDQILRGLGWADLPGAHLLLKIVGIAVAVAGDMVIFWWVLVGLPQIEVPVRIAVRGALLAALGFEVLKIVGTYTIAHTANSPTAGPFAGIIAVLIWMQLVARLVLFACAWTATLTHEHRVALTDRRPVAEPAAVAVEQRDAISSAAVGAALLTAGALVGAVATWAVLRPHQRGRL
jgi:membrane protein